MENFNREDCDIFHIEIHIKYDAVAKIFNFHIESLLKKYKQCRKIMSINHPTNNPSLIPSVIYHPSYFRDFCALKSGHVPALKISDPDTKKLLQEVLKPQNKNSPITRFANLFSGDEASNIQYAEQMYPKGIEVDTFLALSEPLNVDQETNQLITSGMKYYFRHQFDEAINNLSAVLEKYPNILYINFTLGKIYKSKGELSKALLYFTKVAMYASNNAENTNHLAETLYELKLYDKAILVYQKLIDSRIHGEKACLQLGICYQKLLRHPEAIRSFQKGLTFNTQNDNMYAGIAKSYAQMGLLHECSIALKMIASILPQATYPYRNLAHVYMKQERFEKAIWALEKLNGLNHITEKELFTLGKLYIQEKQYKKAKQTFETFENLSTHNKDTARQYLVAIYQELLKQSPNNEDLLIDLGSTYVSMRDLHSAFSIYDRLLAIESIYADIFWAEIEGALDLIDEEILA